MYIRISKLMPIQDVTDRDGTVICRAYHTRELEEKK